ncbi:hypothetical protein ACODYM_29110 [Burkholderia gladioli]|uniref:hypothetical protein n=1 Tax=Burkholderia gladioli TaxID=28095 RepID=UPI003B512AF9
MSAFIRNLKNLPLNRVARDIDSIDACIYDAQERAEVAMLRTNHYRKSRAVRLDRDFI